MKAPATIEIGTLDFTLISLVGNKAIYRAEDTTLAPIHRRTFTVTATPNSVGTNVNVAFKLVTPVTSTVNGITTALNRRVFSGSYTSLQNVIDATDGKDVDDTVAAIAALKPVFLDGSL